MIQVNTLFLIWMPPSERSRRYLVGRLTRSGDSYEFSYLTDSQDYVDAIKNGFTGYPAFGLNKGPFTNNVMDTFMKRLPPRSRRDFGKFLANHHLSENFDGSDFDLIVHTGISLPSDGFDLLVGN